jgi:hypothetical protein
MTNNESTEAAAGKADIVERLNKWSNSTKYGADNPMIAEAATEIASLRERVKELDRIERNRDMWKGQCERQATELARLQPYVAAFRREEERADALGTLMDDLEARAETAERLTSLRDVLILCGELGGMRPSESEASYLRRLIDGLIDAERKLAKAMEFITIWSHDGSLQTYEDRERFRAAARAITGED